jgi:hypothetical protein
MMLVPWPVVEASRDVLHRLELGAGVVLGDVHHQAGQHQPMTAAPVQRICEPP